MAFLSRDQIKGFVTSALHEVADFNGDVENYTFEHFHDYHKQVFANTLKKLIMQSPYYDRNGNSSMDRYYDVPLSMTLINSWATIKESIDYVLSNQAVRPRDPRKVQLS